MAFFSLWTQTGLDKRAAAEAGGDLVQITQMAFGDGNGAEIVPDLSMTALVNEVGRYDVEVIYIDNDNPNWVWVEAKIPMDAGPWWIREVGLFDAVGDMVAVGNYPDTYKPILDEGAGKDLYVRVPLAMVNTSTVELITDPSVVMASREYVDGVVTDLNLAIDSIRRRAFFYSNTF